MPAHQADQCRSLWFILIERAVPLTHSGVAMVKPALGAALSPSSVMAYRLDRRQPDAIEHKGGFAAALRLGHAGNPILFNSLHAY